MRKDWVATTPLRSGLRSLVVALCLILTALGFGQKPTISLVPSANRPLYALDLGGFAYGSAVKVYVLPKAELQRFVNREIPLGKLKPKLVLSPHERIRSLLVPKGFFVLVAGNGAHAVLVGAVAKQAPTTWGNEPILRITTNTAVLSLAYSVPVGYSAFAIVQPYSAYNTTVDTAAKSSITPMNASTGMISATVSLSGLPSGDYIVWIGTRPSGSTVNMFNRVAQDALGTFLVVHR